MSVVVTYSTSLGCELPLSETLAGLAELNAHSVDLLCIEGWAHQNPSKLAAEFPRSVAQLRAQFETHGLRIGSLNTMTGAPLHLRDQQNQERRAQESTALLELMSHFQIPSAALQPPLRRWSSWTDKEQDDAIVSTHEEVERALLAGKRFALELHSDSPFSTPAQIDRLLHAWPDVPLVFDPSHFIAQGLPLAATEPWMETAQLVHLRDAAPGHLQTPFGQGTIDFDWLLGTLRDYGFDGVISIEYLGFSNAGFAVKDSARRLHDLVCEVFS